jgi:hypothetical protein
VFPILLAEGSDHYQLMDRTRKIARVYRKKPDMPLKLIPLYLMIIVISPRGFDIIKTTLKNLSCRAGRPFQASLSAALSVREWYRILLFTGSYQLLRQRVAICVCHFDLVVSVFPQRGCSQFAGMPWRGRYGRTTARFHFRYRK